MNTLHAGALRLDPLVASHAEEMFAVLSDPAIYEFENQPPPSVAALRARYAKLESRVSPDGGEQWLNWVIRLPGGELAGFVQATVLVGGRAYVAYELGSRFWRQGIGSASVQAVLSELARQYSVRDAYAVLKSANHRSRALLAKLGFAEVVPPRRAPWPAEPDEVTFLKALAAQDGPWASRPGHAQVRRPEPAAHDEAPPGMHIETLTASHAPAYRELMLEAYTLAADAFTSTAEERAAEPLAWWEQRIASATGLSESFGAFTAGRLVGTVALEYTLKPKTRHSALVLGMYVRPEARGQGAGHALLQAAVAAARARPGIELLHLTVTEGNTAALRLYESEGFVAWGTEPQAIRTPGGFRGKVHMSLLLGRRA